MRRQAARAAVGPVALLLAALLLAPALHAQRTLVVQRFDAVVDVAADGTVRVDETIVARFTGSWNGIFRTIPVEYRTPQGLNYTLRLNVESVTDDQGRELRVERERERHYLKLRIWVPGAQDATRTVRLRYRVDNALRFFEEHDELYWNVTGDEWEVPIESASAVVRLPAAATGVRATAFRGTYGSTEQSAVSVEANAVRVATTRGLGFREGLTVAVGWNPGVVRRPTALERAGSVATSNIPLAVPPLVFVAMFMLWRARGRDPELAPLTTRYEPPEGMSPAELGTLVDGRPDMRDLTATIVDLAVRGHLHITQTEEERFFGLVSNTDYAFTRTSPAPADPLRSHEQDLLTSMFGSASAVRLSDLKNKFYKHLPKLKGDLYKMLEQRGYFTWRPDHVRGIFIAIAIAAGVLIVVVSSAVMTGLGMQPTSGVIAGIASGLIVAGFGWFMPARTVRGTREVEKVLGFQEFLTRVESDRLDRMVKTPEMFERFLPYAMALGVEDNWAKAFEGIYTEPPRWYTGTGPMHTFRPSTFTSNLGMMSAQAATVMASSPRSSGGSGFSGGSSGGGFGGGGGGGF
jgi:uncharacterized membrane protein